MKINHTCDLLSMCFLNLVLQFILLEVTEAKELLLHPKVKHTIEAIIYVIKFHKVKKRILRKCVQSFYA